MSDKFSELESKIGFSFKDKDLLLTALTHRSYLNENPGWRVVRLHAGAVQVGRGVEAIRSAVEAQQRVDQAGCDEQPGRDAERQTHRLAEDRPCIVDVRLAKPGVYTLHPAGRHPQTADTAQALRLASRVVAAVALLAACVALAGLGRAFS